MTESLINVLLVEDNPGDVELTRQALRESKLLLNLHVVPDGDQAMDFLHGQGDHEQAPRPDLMILDLNLPGLDGRQVLTRTKCDPALASIPVVVMSSSTAEEDILRSYEAHANAYVTKPLDLVQFSRVVSSLEDFWFSIVRLPGH